jgi:hypothetical protein
MRDQYAIIRPGYPGPHWQVIESGQEVYVANIEPADEGRIVRYGTKAALCVPLRVEGVLAGTLSLQSPFQKIYAPQIPLVEALAGAIGRTLADGRAASESDVLQTAAFALAKRHQYSGQLRELHDLTNLASSGPKQAKFNKLMESMQATLADLRAPVTVEASVKASLWEICRDEVKFHGLEFRGLSKPDSNLYHLSLASPASSNIASMLRQLLSNIHYHQSSVGDSPSIRFRTIRLNGTEQALITIKNTSRRPVDESQCATLYRYPVRTESGTFRLGAYIAGLNARSVGALIHAMPRHDGTVFKTTIIIPVGELCND